MDSNARRSAFLGWQCRIRQIVVRDQQPASSGAIVPSVSVTDAEGDKVVGEVITILSKKAEYEVTNEFRHIYRKTFDPGERVTSALKLLGEYYYQASHEFSDQLTATFNPESQQASSLVAHGQCVMKYQQFTQGYKVKCKVQRLEKDDHLYQATFWHNVLFNPNLPRDVIILSFVPDWSESEQIH